MSLQLRGYIDSFANETKGLLTTQIEIKDLLTNYTINNEVNRDISDHRIPKIIKYIETFGGNMGIYLPSIILVSEGDDPEINDAMNIFTFKGDFKFVILDGQHRIKALERFVNREINQTKIEEILNSTVTAQIYFNLTKEEQRRLFLDINATSKKVSQSLAFKFDRRDLINVIIKDLLDTDGSNLKGYLKVTEKTRVSRPGNKDWMSIPRLHRYLLFLLFNTNTVSDKNNKLLNENYFEIIEFLEQYFQLLIEIFPQDFGDVQKYILGHEALQNALAIVTHEKIIQYRDNKIVIDPDWKDIVETLHLIDWTPEKSVLSNQLIGSVSYKYFKDNKHSEVLPVLRSEWNRLLEDLAVEAF